MLDGPRPPNLRPGLSSVETSDLGLPCSSYPSSRREYHVPSFDPVIVCCMLLEHIPTTQPHLVIPAKDKIKTLLLDLQNLILDDYFIKLDPGDVDLEVATVPLVLLEYQFSRVHLARARWRLRNLVECVHEDLRWISLPRVCYVLHTQYSLDLTIGLINDKAFSSAC